MRAKEKRKSSHPTISAKPPQNTTAKAHKKEKKRISKSKENFKKAKSEKITYQMKYKH
jgi:hypothetical protein